MTGSRAGIGLMQPTLFPHCYTTLLCCLCFVSVSAQGSKIMCTTPLADPLQDTVLTCHFPEDLSVTKKDFTIYNYGKDSSPEAVLDCWWVKSSLDCHTKADFAFDRIVSNTLNLTVRHVTMDQTGIYACQVSSYGSSYIETCKLQFKIGELNTCNITQLRLTCLFDEDVHETKSSFAVYRHNGQEKQSVVDCRWNNGTPSCQVEKGYHFNNKVSSYLTVEIPKAKDEETTVYSCWHEGSGVVKTKTCSLDALDKESHKGMTVGISVGVLALTASVIIGIVVFMKHRRSQQADEEIQPMLSVMDNSQVTKKFETFLLENVRKMFPNMLEGCYFVPPVYFNKTRYRTQTIAVQDVYVPEMPDENEARHDRAMQHVLHCLRHLAEQEQEQMFVLTQIKYHDYLINPGHEYAGHCLPVPENIKYKSNEKDIGCFDFLIIHRQYGVLIGVVKSLSVKDDRRLDSEQKLHKLIVKELSTTIKQLQKAEEIINHITSDQEPPTIQLTLVVPNVPQSTLQRVLLNKTGIAEKFRKCMKTDGDATLLCLCANHLSSTETPWNVDPNAMSHLKEWWGRLMSRKTMTDRLYETMIARFCGPATVSNLEFSDDIEPIKLPKTLDQAISLTGDLLQRVILQTDLMQLLDEDRVFLSGPPGTGKTKMLVLIGRKWISEGHNVYLLNTSTEGVAATIELQKLLLQTSATQLPGTQTQGTVIPFFCQIEKDQQADEVIRNLIDHANEKRFFALADEIAFDQKKSEKVLHFIRNLHQRFPSLCLWTVGSSSRISLPKWKGKLLPIPISCPPSVIREAWKGEWGPNIDKHACGKYLPPTDGLPVKVFIHEGQEHKKKEPHDCEACGKDIIRFLTKDLHVAGHDTRIDPSGANDTNHQTTHRQPSMLRYSDILILFEKDITENAFVKSFVQSGIPVTIVNSKNQKEILKNDGNTVLAAKTGFLCGLKRKVVVYVEEDTSRKEFFSRWNRLRGITSCSSQLVFVRKA